MGKCKVRFYHWVYYDFEDKPELVSEKTVIRQLGKEQTAKLRRSACQNKSGRAMHAQTDYAPDHDMRVVAVRENSRAHSEAEKKRRTRSRGRVMISMRRS